MRDFLYHKATLGMRLHFMVYNFQFDVVCVVQMHIRSSDDVGLLSTNFQNIYDVLTCCDQDVRFSVVGQAYILVYGCFFTVAYVLNNNTCTKLICVLNCHLFSVILTPCLQLKGRSHVRCTLLRCAGKDASCVFTSAAQQRATYMRTDLYAQCTIRQETTDYRVGQKRKLLYCDGYFKGQTIVLTSNIL